MIDTSVLPGVRVLDLTQVAAGPYATLLLGYMGAEVIKVESCSRMDINRGAAQPVPGAATVYPSGEPGPRPWNRAAHHVQRNANKLSLTLDLATERGRGLLVSLAALADVLVENFRASVMDRLQLGYDVLSRVNPSLIYVKVTSQGATGPESDYGSLGSTLEQTGGLASITGYEDEVPLMTNETYPDPVVGIMATGIIVAALRQRRMTGRGAFVDLSQREITVGLLGEAVVDYSIGGRVAKPVGNRHPAMSPHGCYPCKGEDMWMVISVSSDAEWDGLCRGMGLPGLADDPMFATVLSRLHNREELDAVIAAWTRERDHYQAMHTLQAHGVPAGAVAKGSELVADPHLVPRGFWDTVRHAEAGKYRQVTTPWKLSRTPRVSTTPAPGLGEHNSLILGDMLGLPVEEARDLEQTGIIGTLPAELSQAGREP